MNTKSKKKEKRKEREKYNEVRHQFEETVVNSRSSYLVRLLKSRLRDYIVRTQRPNKMRFLAVEFQTKNGI